jgi:hypothetical protein
MGKKNKVKVIKVGQVGFLKMYMSTLNYSHDSDFVVIEDDHLNVYSQDDLDKLYKDNVK